MICYTNAWIVPPSFFVTSFPVLTWFKIPSVTEYEGQISQVNLCFPVTPALPMVHMIQICLLLESGGKPSSFQANLLINKVSLSLDFLVSEVMQGHSMDFFMWICLDLRMALGIRSCFCIRNSAWCKPSVKSPWELFGDDDPPHPFHLEKQPKDKQLMHFW